MLPVVLKRQCDHDIFRNYIANGIQMISENTSKWFGGRYLTTSYNDIINPKPVDERTGDEIVVDIVRNAGLKIVGSEDGDLE